MFRRILVPLDGTPAMATALPTLRRWISGTGAVVHLLVVRPMPRLPWHPDGPPLYLDDLLRIEHATWQQYLVHHGSALAYDGIVVHREVRFGAQAPEILAAADRHDAHLIALAPPRQTWRQRLFAVPLSQQLAARARVPVLLLPPADPRAGGAVFHYRRVAA